MTAPRWAMVRAGGGPPVLAWVDGARWRGWLVPWFPDASMEHLSRVYFEDEPERAPYATASGEFCIIDDEDEIVRLERHRKPVVINGERGALALTDSGRMAWCWEEAPADGLADALALTRDDFTPAAKRGKAGKRGRS